MREYGKLAPTFWTRGTGKALRGHPEAQVVAAYLMSAPTSNMIGLYYIPIETISLETGIPLEGAREGLSRLSEGGFCSYDYDNDFVFVHTMARRQLGLEEGECLKHDGPDPRRWDQRCLGALKQMRECDVPELLQAFWERYRDVFGLPEPWWTLPLKEAPREPLSRAPIAPREPGSGSGSGSGSGTGAGGAGGVECAVAEEPPVPEVLRLEAEEPAKPKPKARTVKTLLPSGWAPTAAHYAQAEREGGRDRAWVDAQAERMRDWAGTKGERCVDWDARFRNWIRKALETPARQTGRQAPMAVQPGGTIYRGLDLDELDRQDAARPKPVPAPAPPAESEHDRAMREMDRRFGRATHG